MDRILHIGEVSELTGIPENTLRYYRAQSQGDRARRVGPPSAKFGKRIVYRESDVRAWIDAQFAAADG